MSPNPNATMIVCYAQPDLADHIKGLEITSMSLCAYSPTRIESLYAPSSSKLINHWVLRLCTKNSQNPVIQLDFTPSLRYNRFLILFVYHHSSAGFRVVKEIRLLINQGFTFHEIIKVAMENYHSESEIPDGYQVMRWLRAFVELLAKEEILIKDFPITAVQNNLRALWEDPNTSILEHSGDETMERKSNSQGLGTKFFEGKRTGITIAKEIISLCRLDNSNERDAELGCIRKVLVPEKLESPLYVPQAKSSLKKANISDWQMEGNLSSRYSAPKTEISLKSWHWNKLYGSQQRGIYPSSRHTGPSYIALRGCDYCYLRNNRPISPSYSEYACSSYHSNCSKCRRPSSSSEQTSPIKNPLEIHSIPWVSGNNLFANNAGMMKNPLKPNEETLAPKNDLTLGKTSPIENPLRTNAPAWVPGIFLDSRLTAPSLKVPNQNKHNEGPSSGFQRFGMEPDPKATAPIPKGFRSQLLGNCLDFRQTAPLPQCSSQNIRNEVPASGYLQWRESLNRRYKVPLPQIQSQYVQKKAQSSGSQLIGKPARYYHVGGVLYEGLKMEAGHE